MQNNIVYKLNKGQNIEGCAIPIDGGLLMAAGGKKEFFFFLQGVYGARRGILP